MKVFFSMRTDPSMMAAGEGGREFEQSTFASELKSSAKAVRLLSLKLQLASAHNLFQQQLAEVFQHCIESGDVEEIWKQFPETWSHVRELRYLDRHRDFYVQKWSLDNHRQRLLAEFIRTTLPAADTSLIWLEDCSMGTPPVLNWQAQPACPLENIYGFFTLSIQQGMDLPLALLVWGRPLQGRYSDGDTVFWSDECVEGRAAERSFTLQADNHSPVEVFIAGTSVVCIRGVVPLRYASFVLSYPSRSGGGGSSTATRFMHEQCQLEVDKNGLPKKPKLVVGQLFEHRAAWVKALGSLSRDVDRLISGRVVIPKINFPFIGQHLANLPSWRDEAVQAALWPTIAKWAWAGCLEYVGPRGRVPKFILPCGGVPKETSPFWRLITDG